MDTPEAGRHKLSHMANDSQELLVTAETFFPLDLFPDTITIDRIKVTVTKRMFFMVAEVISMQIEDILNVEGDVGPYFGSLKIWTRFFSNKPLRITKLTRNDTLNIKQILQGYVIARHKKIDCSAIKTEELVPLLSQLGQEGG
jgi:hypothetical protein